MVEGTVKGSCLIALAATLALLNPVSASATEPVRGFTRCAADLQLSFPLAGRISRAQVREGSLVKKGDLLMQLDRAAEELDVERRKVQWQGTADLLVAQARHETAVKQLAAARTIFNENRGVSMEEVQNRELAVRTTQAELERVKTLKETERLDYQTALENLERRNLVAGTSGIVTRIIKQAGESAQAYEAVLRLCDLSRVEFMANMPTEQTGRLREGQAVKVQVSSVPPATVSARVTFVSPVVDPASGLREVKADLINPPAWVRPGESAVLQRK